MPVGWLKVVASAMIVWLSLGGPTRLTAMTAPFAPGQQLSSTTRTSRPDTASATGATRSWSIETAFSSPLAGVTWPMPGSAPDSLITTLPPALATARGRTRAPVMGMGVSAAAGKAHRDEARAPSATYRSRVGVMAIPAGARKSCPDDTTVWNRPPPRR